MIRQDFYLPRHGWHVSVYYSTKPENRVEIIRNLRNIGCSGVDLERARLNLSTGRADTGLTYSNFKRRETVMVLSVTSSTAEFLNSWLHEMRHLSRHIEAAFGIDPYGEEAAYLTGSIGQKMFPVAGRFLCEHCRKEKHVTQ